MRGGCTLVLLGGLLFSPAGAALPPGPAAPPALDWAAVTLPAARQVDLSARATGHRYRIFVAPPPGPAPSTGYPVLYVLDGNASFPLAALLARNAAARSERTGQIAALVVGIGYPGERDFDVAARSRDYTPGSCASPADALSAQTGCASAFLRFIETELKPLIAAQHPVDASRQALFGHSFGGLLVLHALFSQPQAFSTYLASSPSIWWQEQALFDALQQLALEPPQAATRVQISVGALEDQAPEGRLSPELQALLASRRMVEPARRLADRLRARPGWAERVDFHELAGEDHGSAWLGAMARGMRLFLTPPSSNELPPSP